MKKSMYFIASILLFVIIFIEFSKADNSITDVFLFQNNKKPIYCVETNDKKIAISFDAAWGADNTEKILDILDSYKVGATFFLVGFWIEKYPDMVKEIDSRGYEIGNHSQNHPKMSQLNTEQMKAEINSVNEKVYNLIGKTPDVFRPPFGDYSDNVIKTMEELQMHTIQWSIDSLDWKEYGKQHLIETAI